MTEIVPSEELRALYLRFYAAWEAQDVEALGEMFSSGAHFVVIGSDPNEWYMGQAGVEIALRQASETSGVVIRPRELTAYRAGDAGWATALLDVKLGGAELVFRASMAAAIEHGQWRIVQWHQSIGQSNEEALGVTLTTSIEAVERSVRSERPDLQPALAPDGTVTIVFTDIVSSTALMDRLGDAEFLRLLAWHDRIIRDAAAQHRGYVVKSQGDGFMLAFPSAAFALRACLTMRDRTGAGFEGLPVGIRIGLHCGEAIRRDHDFYGHTVVIAARIAGLALGGEVLASDLVHALARGLGAFKFGDPRAAKLTGLDGRFDLYPVLE